MIKTPGKIGLALLLIAVLIPVFKVLCYSQQDNEKHLTEKRAYLNSIASLNSDQEGERPNIVLILLDDWLVSEKYKSASRNGLLNSS